MMTFPRSLTLTFDFKNYGDNGRLSFGEGERIRLTELDTGPHLLESPLSINQQGIGRHDGTFDITATVVDSAMLEWLRGFGDRVLDVRRKPCGDTPNVKGNSQ